MAGTHREAAKAAAPSRHTPVLARVAAEAPAFAELESDASLAADVDEGDARDDETRQAGRGLLWIVAAKLFFIVTASGVSIALPRVFGSE